MSSIADTFQAAANAQSRLQDITSRSPRVRWLGRQAAEEKKRNHLSDLIYQVIVGRADGQRNW